MKRFIRDRAEEAGSTIWLSFLAILAVAVIAGGGYAIMKVGAPRMEEVRRDVYLNSSARAFGNQQELARLRLEYETADTDQHKAAIRRLALLTLSETDRTTLEPSLRRWAEQLEDQR